MSVVKVDVFTMDAEPSSHSLSVPLLIFDWQDDRYCFMRHKTYKMLISGADIVQRIIDFEAHFAPYIRPEAFRWQKTHASNLMYYLERTRQRNAYRVAILASRFEADGDHAIMYRVGTCLGKLADWCVDGHFDSHIWHFFP